MNGSVVLRRIGRGMIVAVPVLILLAGAGVVYQDAATAKDRETYPAPGKLIEVNGQVMHLYCIGAGSPTVILESGAGGNSLLWGYIQPTVAKTTRVCTYDRAGYGWSEARSGERTTINVAEELHTLLTHAGIEPPYILAGHSFGGLIIRTYTRLYPDEVVGLVFVDAAHPNQFSSERCTPACFPADAVSLVDTFYEILPTMARTGMVRLLVPGGSLPLPFFAVPADFPNRDAFIASL